MGTLVEKKYCCENGFGAVPKNISSINDKHYTLLGFTALTGQPVMCVVILSGILLSYEVEVGIDIDATVIGEPTDKDYFEKTGEKENYFQQVPNVNLMGRRSQLWFSGHHQEVSLLTYMSIVLQH